MSLQYLFSYGTLQQPEVQQNLFGRKLTGEKDQLPGFIIETIEITDPEFLKHGSKWQKMLKPTNTTVPPIEGIVLELTFEELSKADAYEPSDYKRELVKLASGKMAWVYLAK